MNMSSSTIQKKKVINFLYKNRILGLSRIFWDVHYNGFVFLSFVNVFFVVNLLCCNHRISNQPILCPCPIYLNAFQCSAAAKFSEKVTFFTPWYAHAAFLYPLKTCKNLLFLTFSGGIEKLRVRNRVRNVNFLENFAAAEYWKALT